jgi:hypothetical protein
VKEAQLEYSSREVSPQKLLLQQVLKAHSVFLLHHAASLADLYVRLTRAKFCAALERFWYKFTREWDVLLHGIPAIDVFRGVRLAAGGEIGIGVGEEEWGSGEREVLEGFVHRTDGLIDIVVSRFGDSKADESKTDDTWLGTGQLPKSSDGVIFSGIGNVTRSSLIGVSKWVEWIYQNGLSAYGVQDNPHAAKRKKRRKPNSRPAEINQNLDAWPTGIPPPIISAASQSLNKAVSQAEQQQQRQAEIPTSTSMGGTEVLMKYMTFGLYGSGWGLTGSKTPDLEENASRSGSEAIQNKPKTIKTPKSMEPEMTETQISPKLPDFSKGCFLIGLKGDLDDEEALDFEDRTDSGGDIGLTKSRDYNSRILLRTLHVERKRVLSKSEEADIALGKVPQI